MGKLYNWYAVNDPRGLVPFGWRIPENRDWYDLENVVYNDEWAGRSLKSSNSWDWKNGTDELGFNGLAGGYRKDNGTFSLLHQYVGYWTIGRSVFCLKTNDNRLLYDSKLDGCGLYVRCIKKQ